MRTVHVKVTVDLTIKADDDVEIQEIIDEMDYSFVDQTHRASIEDSKILDHEVTDSR